MDIDKDVFSDDRHSPEEQEKLRAFYEICLSNRSSLQVGYEELKNLSRSANIDIGIYYKESVFMQALWYVYLVVVKEVFDSKRFKYQSIEQFFEVYPAFQSIDNKQEQLNLFQTANWMSILFTMVVAKKSKGLAILLVPKLIEGWNAKYVTGSGQKKSTADRVHIYETEGKVVPHARGKVRTRESGKNKGGARRKRLVVKHKATASPRADDKIVKVLKKRGRKPKYLLNGGPLTSGDKEGEDALVASDATNNNSTYTQLDIKVVDSAKLKKQEAAHRWIDKVMNRSYKSASESKEDSDQSDSSDDDEESEQMKSTDPSPHSIVDMDPLLLAFPESMSYASFEMGALSRDVSRTLKIDDGQELLNADMTKLDRYNSTMWGDLMSGTLSPRSSEIVDSLFMN